MAEYRSLYAWWSPSRGDNFATSDQGWSPGGLEGWRRSPDYGFVRHEGFLFAPENPQPGTIALHHWWSPGRGDNFTTTDPQWAGRPGDTRSPDYAYVGLLGHVVHPDRANVPPNVARWLLPLWRWWSPSRGDNFITSNSAWGGAPGSTRSPDYGFVRFEGFTFSWQDGWQVPE